MPNNISFSLWCDLIERDFLENEFIKMIEGGIIQGATSNPAIFQKSFYGGKLSRTKRYSKR